MSQSRQLAAIMFTDIVGYTGDFDKAGKLLNARDDRYSFLKSYLYASKGESDKVTPEHRNDIFILLASNRNKVLKDVIKRLEEVVEKGDNTYDWLSNSIYFDAYRENPDFKRVLAKAKKNHESKLLKYGNVEIPD